VTLAVAFKFSLKDTVRCVDDEGYVFRKNGRFLSLFWTYLKPEESLLFTGGKVCIDADVEQVVDELKGRSSLTCLTTGAIRDLLDFRYHRDFGEFGARQRCRVFVRRWRRIALGGIVSFYGGRNKLRQERLGRKVAQRERALAASSGARNTGIRSRSRSGPGSG